MVAGNPAIPRRLRSFSASAFELSSVKSAGLSAVTMCHYTRFAFLRVLFPFAIDGSLIVSVLPLLPSNSTLRFPISKPRLSHIVEPRGRFAFHLVFQFLVRCLLRPATGCQVLRLSLRRDSAVWSGGLLFIAHAWKRFVLCLAWKVWSVWRDNPPNVSKSPDRCQCDP
jgi:hypothetical protein